MAAVANDTSDIISGIDHEIFMRLYRSTGKKRPLRKIWRREFRRRDTGDFLHVNFVLETQGRISAFKSIFQDKEYTPISATDTIHFGRAGDLEPSTSFPSAECGK
jgi:hypothetical protein